MSIRNKSIVIQVFSNVDVEAGSEHVRKLSDVLPGLAVLFHHKLLIHGDLLEIRIRDKQGAYFVTDRDDVAEVGIPDNFD